MKETIIQHNSISNAKHDLSTTQMDVLFVLISKLRDDDPLDKVYKIPVKQLEEYTNTPINYKRLREATKELGSKSFEQVFNDGSYEQIWIFSRVKYEMGKGALYIRLSPDIRPYLFDLKRNFTIINLQHILRMRSKFSKRIYQIICSKRNLGKFTIDLDALKERLGVAEQYRKFSAFRRYVLDVAEQEVSRSDVSFTYDTLKQGRKITDIEFKIQDKKKQLKSAKQVKNPPNGSKTHVEKPVHPEQHLHQDKVNLYEKCHSLGLTDAQIVQIFHAMKFQEITKILYQISLALSDGGIRNKRAFVCSQFPILKKEKVPATAE